MSSFIHSLAFVLGVEALQRGREVGVRGDGKNVQFSKCEYPGTRFCLVR